MEHVFQQLVQDFEDGKLNRRQLIQSLMFIATSSLVGTALAQDATKPAFKAVNVNHISFDFADYTKIRDFYAGVFGMKVFGDNNGQQCHVQCGPTTLTLRNRKSNTPQVQHIAIEIENYDKRVIETEMKARGIKLEFDGGGDPKILDPEGFTVQIAPKGFAIPDFNERPR